MDETQANSPLIDPTIIAGAEATSDSVVAVETNTLKKKEADREMGRIRKEYR